MIEIIETFIISIISLIKQHILYFDEINKIKLARFQDLIKELKKFVEKFANANNAKNIKMKMI